MPPSTMPQISNIIFLMLENRSLDNLLGYLYGHSVQPTGYFPADPTGRWNGIPLGASQPAFDWSHTLYNYPIRPIDAAGMRARDQDPTMIPWYDPSEEWLSRFDSGRGVLNQLFGDQNMVSEEPPAGTLPRMRGFMQDYWTWASNGYSGQDILWMYHYALLPNFHTAAWLGATSDAWHASVPTQTNPNRAYSLVGTSLGRDANEDISAVEQFPVPTIFNALTKNNKSCGFYFTDVWIKDTGQSYTDYTFPQMRDSGTEIGHLETFYKRAANGTLPDFTYLEPKWGYAFSGSIEPHQGTDMHPPMSVTPGDQFVAQVLRAVMRSPQWPHSLVVLTFDEHGGTYDHVPPPWGAKSPDDIPSANGFKFNLFGVRVPTILFSPWAPMGSVFRAPAESKYPFDHTSFIKTFLGWAGADIPTAGFFKRMQAAPTFDYIMLKSDSAASDNSAAIHARYPVTLPPPQEPRPNLTINHLFDGVGRAAVRTIIATSRSPEEMMRKIDEYRRDPSAFERKLMAR